MNNLKKYIQRLTSLIKECKYTLKTRGNIIFENLKLKLIFLLNLSSSRIYGLNSRNNS